MAVEAVKFGYGGRSYMASVVGRRRDTVVRLMWKMATKRGLTTTVHVIKKLSQSKRKATNALGEDLPIEFEAIVPRWTARPSRG